MPVIEGVSRELACLKTSSLPDPSTVSYCAYELGVLSDLQVGEIMYNRILHFLGTQLLLMENMLMKYI